MRHFTPYEQTQLAKYKISPSQAKEWGEMPVEYMTGHVDFNGLDLLVNPDVLIPRIETEELALRATKLTDQIITVHKQLPSSPSILRILDLGTGCGAIAIYLAHQISEKQLGPTQCQIIASDISPSALAVARENARRCLTASSSVKIEFVLSDLWQNIDQNDKFDLVVANLPYIPSPRIPVLDASVKSFEPWLALDGGPDGLKLIGAMLTEAPSHLAPHGVILLEVDYTHDLSAFRPWTKQLIFWADVDQNLHQRFITARLG